MKGESLDVSKLILSRTTEKEFMQHVIQAARAFGWLVYHTYDSRRSGEGFPDLVLLKPPHLLFVELKSEKGTLSKEQTRWLNWLDEAGNEVRVWRPSHWPVIVHTLSAGFRM